MGEARRRAEKGMPPKHSKNAKVESPRVWSWLPITERQREQFFSITQTGGWIGIGVVLLIWIVVRFVGPWAGWWFPADAR